MDVLQPTRRVRLKVATNGNAPKYRGNRVYKIIRDGEEPLLAARGWVFAGRCRRMDYIYMRPPANIKGEAPFSIEATIPTRDQIMTMAEAAHAAGVSWKGCVGEWPAGYYRSSTSRLEYYTAVRENEVKVESRWRTSEAGFEVGYHWLWDAGVTWRDGKVFYGEKGYSVIGEEGGAYLPFAEEAQYEEPREKVSEGEVLEPAPFLPERILRAIAERKGQADFRSKLLAAYGGRCAITECDAEPALEAAHILGYAETGSQSVNNGLLLRADVHTLFDTGHVRIHPESLTVVLSDALTKTCYADLAGKPLRLPEREEDKPNKEALGKRWQNFVSGEKLRE